jgi:hypothetical protein
VARYSFILGNELDALCWREQRFPQLGAYVVFHCLFPKCNLAYIGLRGGKYKQQKRYRNEMSYSAISNMEPPYFDQSNKALPSDRVPAHLYIAG